MSFRLKNIAAGSFLVLSMVAGPRLGANAANARHGDAAAVTLTYWWWAESDIPGADRWMRQTVSLFEKAHPNIQVKVDIQTTDNLISNFQAAAAAHSGPDIATQWATIPVLSQAWAGAISPVSDYIPKSEIAHWANTAENIYAGKVWGMPLYLIGQPVAYNKALFVKAALDPNKPPTTWDQFLADCAKLKARGIIPFAMGNKDGFGGASFWSLFGKGELNSADDIKRAVVGQTAFTDSRFTGWLTGLQTMKNNGYLNDDVASLDLNNGTNAFAQGKAGMTFSTDANIVSFASALGEARVGVFRAPPIGTGKLGSWYDATQSSSEMITSWSRHKREAATFLMFMHTPERLAAFYQQTGGFPADNRFKLSTVKDPLQKQMLAWDLLPNNIWLENFVPTQIDLNGDQIAGETVTSNSGGPDTAALLWERTAKQWRLSNPAEMQHFKAWIGAAL